MVYKLVIVYNVITTTHHCFLVYILLSQSSSSEILGPVPEHPHTQYISLLEGWIVDVPDTPCTDLPPPSQGCPGAGGEGRGCGVHAHTAVVPEGQSEK